MYPERRTLHVERGWPWAYLLRNSLSHLAGLLIQTSLALVLAACAQPVSPRPAVDLPTAVPPVTRPESVWAITFQHEFPPGFWDEGSHQYALDARCPEDLELNASSQFRPFLVTADAPVLSTPVFLRLSGLSGSLVGPPTMMAIHPEQRTVAALTFLGVSESSVPQIQSECVIEIIWDDKPAEQLTPQEPFQP